MQMHLLCICGMHMVAELYNTCCSALPPTLTHMPRWAQANGDLTTDAYHASRVAISHACSLYELHCVTCRFLNHTKTVGGARLLRANLLQPLTCLATLRMRQDAVQDLVGNDDLAFTVGQGLNQMPKDLDRCI